MIRGSGIINNTVRRAVATEAVGRTRPALAPFLGGANPAAAASVSRVAVPICGFSGAKLAVAPKLSVGANVGAKPRFCGLSVARLFSTCGFSGQSLPDE